jgi:hypothetical protein
VLGPIGDGFGRGLIVHINPDKSVAEVAELNSGQPKKTERILSGRGLDRRELRRIDR